MTISTLKRLRRNEYFRITLMIILIIVVVFGFWYGSQLILNTQYPALAVASGSMCMVKGMKCDGWSHPFSTTLHIGDLIIVQGVGGDEINAAPYPDGDIIVFRRPQAGDELIVHRAIEKQTTGGKISFRTKGDGNSSPDITLVSVDNVIGKVVLRIPWVGHIALLMHDSSGMYIIIALIIILVIVEFVIPAFTGKGAKAGQKEDVEKAFEV